MRIMTPQTLSLFNRLMDDALILLFFGIGMTGITEVFHLLLQQTAETGNMGAVAGETFPFTRRLMFHPFLESVAVMTHKTVYRRHGQPLGQQQKTDGQNQSEYVA